MWLSLAVLLLGAPPDQGEADVLLKTIEKQVLQAKTLQMEADIVQPGKDTSWKARLKLSHDNKLRLEILGPFKGKQGKWLMRCNGTQLQYIGVGSLGRVQKVPKDLSERMLGAVTRAGVYAPTFLAVRTEPGEDPPFVLDKELAVSDVELGKKEPVAGREAQIVDYTLTMRWVKEPLAVSIWIDVKTSLPVKRVIRFGEGEERTTVTETYTTFVPDVKLPDNAFEFPK
jgi:hypothetical protein